MTLRSRALADRIPTRRRFLQVGALGGFGLSLPTLLQAEAMTTAAGRSTGRAKSGIFIFLWGGPSHIDTFDMKPLAPDNIRGEFKPIQTTVPGMHIVEHLPRMACLAQHFSIIRTLHHNKFIHQPAGSYLLTGVDPGTTIQTYSYNAQGQLTRIVYAATGNVLSYTYTNGVLSTATLKDSNGALLQTYNYNGQGQVSSIKDGNGNLLYSYSYNAQGQLSTIVYANSNILTYMYTGDGSAATAKLTDRNNTLLQTQTYDVYGRLTKIVYANGNVYSRTYSSDGISTATLKNSSGTVLHTYTYDAQGNLVSQT